MASAKVDIDRTMPPPASYRLDDGRTMYLSALVDENAPTLQFALSDGLQGRMQRTAPDDYADRSPCPVSVRFLPGAAVELTECKRVTKGMQATRLAEQLLTITANDGKSLGASIWQLEGTHPDKAIVLTHGADDETRQMGVIIPQLAAAGYAVLTFDQRGTGESTGQWRADGIAQIADDAALLAKKLQQVAGIEPVGFFGFSNGGWIAPAAAVRFGHPAFVLIKSGDSGSVEDNVLFETATAVADHAGQAAGGRARAVMKSMFTALHSDSDTDWLKARQALLGVQGESWFQYTQLPPPAALPLAGPVKDGYRRQLFFDPRADLLRLTCPVLVLLGDLDVDVDGPRSAALYQQYFAQAHNAQGRVVRFPTAGHQLVSGPGEAANNSMVTGRYVPGYPSTMIQWLATITPNSNPPVERNTMSHAPATPRTQAFMVKLVPPRPSFAFDATETERATMKRHSMYWQQHVETGLVVAFGPVNHPDGAFGIGLLRAVDEAEVRQFTAGDPAMAEIAGFKIEIYPMMALHPQP